MVVPLAAEARPDARMVSDHRHHPGRRAADRCCQATG
jgi:hypothetical protein